MIITIKTETKCKKIVDTQKLYHRRNCFMLYEMVESSAQFNLEMLINMKIYISKLKKNKTHRLNPRAIIVDFSGIYLFKNAKMYLLLKRINISITTVWFDKKRFE